MRPKLMVTAVAAAGVLVIAGCGSPKKAIPVPASERAPAGIPSIFRPNKLWSAPIVPGTRPAFSANGNDAYLIQSAGSGQDKVVELNTGSGAPTSSGTWMTFPTPPGPPRLDYLIASRFGSNPSYLRGYAVATIPGAGATIKIEANFAPSPHPASQLFTGAAGHRPTATVGPYGVLVAGAVGPDPQSYDISNQPGGSMVTDAPAPPAGGTPVVLANAELDWSGPTGFGGSGPVNWTSSEHVPPGAVPGSGRFVATVPDEENPGPDATLVTRWRPTTGTGIIAVLQDGRNGQVLASGPVASGAFGPSPVTVVGRAGKAVAGGVTFAYNPPGENVPEPVAPKVATIGLPGFVPEAMTAQGDVVFGTLNGRPLAVDFGGKILAGRPSQLPISVPQNIGLFLTNRGSTLVAVRLRADVPYR